LLHSYADLFFGSSPTLAADPGDTTAARATTPKKRFAVYDSGGVSGLVFVALREAASHVAPAAFAARMIAHMIAHPEAAPACHALQRIVPVERLCLANESDIVETARSMIPLMLPDADPQGPSLTFAVVVEKRNNDRVDKSSLVGRLAGLVAPQHRVDLRLPTVVILVQIFKSACGVSVLRDYHAMARYSVRRIAPNVHARSEASRP